MAASRVGKREQSLQHIFRSYVPSPRCRFFCEAAPPSTERFFPAFVASSTTCLDRRVEREKVLMCCCAGAAGRQVALCVFGVNQDGGVAPFHACEAVGPAELEQAMDDGVDARFYGSSLNTQSSSPNTLLCCSTRGLAPVDLRVPSERILLLLLVRRLRLVPSLASCAIAYRKKSVWTPEPGRGCHAAGAARLCGVCVCVCVCVVAPFCSITRFTCSTHSDCWYPAGCQHSARW